MDGDDEERGWEGRRKTSEEAYSHDNYILLNPLNCGNQVTSNPGERE